MRDLRAFTLLELLIALAISVIMITLAYPTYVHYETHANRNHAEIALMQVAERLEDYFTNNNTYKNATADDLNLDVLKNDLPYQLVLTTSDAHFTIQAIPDSVQAAKDAVCGILSLTDTAAREISGNGNVDECWR